MLLSLAGTSSSDVEDPDSDFVHASAQVSVSAPESPQSTSVTVSLLPPASEAIAPAPLRGVSAFGDMGFTIVNRPAIFLSDQDGNFASSLGAPASSDGDLYLGTYPDWGPGDWGPGDWDGDPSTFVAQAKELTPEGLAALPRVPWTPNATIKGTLTSDRGWMSFTVPVGPNTNTLRLAVRPAREGEAPVAMVDQMYLVSPDGTLVASVTGVASLAPGRRQTLVVSLQSAPAGGVLVVRMVQPTPNPPVDSTDSGTPVDVPDGEGALTPPTSSVPSDFTVEVQRDDVFAASPGISNSAPVWIFPPASYPPTSSWSTGGGHVSVLPSGIASTSSESGYAVNAASRIENARASVDPIDLDPESTPVSLGPLVSRGSPPMGPALATMIDDPAPSIRRDGQPGGDRSLENLGDEGLEEAFGLNRNAHREGSEVARSDHPGDDEAGEDEAAPVTALKGLGGLPMLVASSRGRRMKARADELAATLRENAEEAAELAARAEDSGLSQPDGPKKEEEIARAGLATRAVGFVIALGLASGPLYPDLVALARRKLARKRRGGSPLLRRFFNRRPPLPFA